MDKDKGRPFHEWAEEEVGKICADGKLAEEEAGTLLIFLQAFDPDIGDVTCPKEGQEATLDWIKRSSELEGADILGPDPFKAAERGIRAQQGNLNN